MMLRLFRNSIKPGRINHVVGLGLVLLLLLLLVTGIISPAYAAPFSEPLRVNAGGGAYTDSLGNSWSADQAYTSGSWGFYGDDLSVDRGTGHAICGTVDDRIYQTERYRLDGYRFDLDDGTYTVILHFAETWLGGPDRRIFDVSIEGATVLDDLDIFSEIGQSTVLKQIFRGVVVTGGQLNIDFASSVEAPLINGIEIFAAGQNTPPELAAIGNDKSVLEGQLLTFTLSATDYEGDPLDYSGDNLPSGASFDAGTLTFSWTPTPGQAGTYPGVYFAVSDGELNDSEEITITVRALLSDALRVNAGGGAYTDSLGNSWSADQAYTSGSWGFYGDDLSVDRGTDHTISGTADERIYQTERYRLDGYRFDLDNGKYTVILHFAETWLGGPDQRNFDVSIEGVIELDDLDIFSEVGQSTALTTVFRDVAVEDGQLDISFASSMEAPLINGIEISAVAGDNTITRTCAGISIAPILIGPSYIFRNTLYDPEPHWQSATLGFKGGTAGTGHVYIYHNTIIYDNRNAGAKTSTGNNGMSQSGSSDEAHDSKNVYFKNNIIEANGYIVTNHSTWPKLDYNLLYNHNNNGWAKWEGLTIGYESTNAENFAVFQSVTDGAGDPQEVHGLPGQADFIDRDNHDYHLADGSPGINSGHFIRGFNDY